MKHKTKIAQHLYDRFNPYTNIRYLEFLECLVIYEELKENEN